MTCNRFYVILKLKKGWFIMENVEYKNKAEELRVIAEKKVREKVEKKKEKEREKILAIYKEILKLSEVSASDGDFKLIVNPSLFSKDSDDKFISDNEFDEYLFSEVTEKLEADGFTVEKFFTGNIAIYW